MISCLICGEEIHCTDQPWRIVDVAQPSAESRPLWEFEIHPVQPDDPDYMSRLGELDGYPAHLACLRRVIAQARQDDVIFRQLSR